MCLWRGQSSGQPVRLADSTCPSCWPLRSSHDGRGRSQGWDRASRVTSALSSESQPHPLFPKHLGAPRYLPMPLAGCTKQRGDPSPVGPRHSSSMLQQQLADLQLSSPGSSSQGWGEGKRGGCQRGGETQSQGLEGLCACALSLRVWVVYDICHPQSTAALG